MKYEKQVALSSTRDQVEKSTRVRMRIWKILGDFVTPADSICPRNKSRIFKRNSDFSDFYFSIINLHMRPGTGVGVVSSMI